MSINAIALALGAHRLLLAIFAAAHGPKAGMAGRLTTLVAGVADAQSGVALAGAEVFLPELRVGARTNALAPLRLRDFELRRQKGAGRYLIDREIEKLAGQEFPLAVATRFPSLRPYTDVDKRWHIATNRDYMNVATGVSPCDITIYR